VILREASLANQLAGEDWLRLFVRTSGHRPADSSGWRDCPTLDYKCADTSLTLPCLVLITNLDPPKTLRVESSENKICANVGQEEKAEYWNQLIAINYVKK